VTFWARVIAVFVVIVAAWNLSSERRTAGAVADSAGTADRALAAIEGDDFDGALLDANLHGRPVHEIAAALTRRGVPFIFITGYGRDGLPISFRKAPALAKPVSEKQLLDAVTNLLSGVKQVAQLKC
jgi:DNA-binding response OmpR family regulator